VPTFAFIGFGELGAALAAGLGRSGGNLLRAFTPPRQPASPALAERLKRTGVERSGSLADALAGATVVLSAVPAGAAQEVAAQSAPHLQAGAYYVDLTTAPVEVKQAGAEAIAAAGGLYVDAAVLGTVTMSGFAVPILASGPGARGWQAIVSREGLAVEVMDGPAGDATRVKLLRSVYMKGRDALIVEMMLAARRYGLEERLAESIQGPGELVGFPALAERVLCSLALHADRRAHELLASSELVRAAGVDPVISRAGSEVLRRVAELQLRSVFGGERPASGGEVLASIDALAGRSGAAGSEALGTPGGVAEEPVED
jgi:3-hydroxyisobutyrate dehydrogenase-like beta-hydroxyacid dehydrogenase